MSKKMRDFMGFGNTEVPEKFKKFSPIKNDLTGVNIAVTGGNSGIGLDAVHKLAKLGATVHILARDKTKVEQLIQEMGGRVTFHYLDVLDFNSIRDLKLPPVDVLIHNAGWMYEKKEFVEWPSGPLEKTFALSVAGPYLLHKLIQPKYGIWVSSGGAYAKKLNVAETINPTGKFDGMAQYALCKRAMIVTARFVNNQSMHPGWVDTPAVRQCMPKFYKKNADILRTPEEGADTIVWLAATRPTQIGFWFDRELVTEYKVPFTKHCESEELKLRAELERITALPIKE